MTETIEEPVTVVFISTPSPKRIVPWKLKWRNHMYTITQIGLHHPIRQGRTLYHIFSVTDGNTFFRLAFDTDNMLWTLEEVSDGNIN